MLESLFNEAAGLTLQDATLLKRDSNTGVCFPVNVAKFLRTALFKEHLWWLLGKYVSCSLFKGTIIKIRKSPYLIKFI